MGLTQQEVASKGITFRYYQELERGQRNPSLKMLHDLADIFEVRVVDLLEVGERRAPVRLADVPDSAAPPRGRKPRVARRSTG